MNALILSSLLLLTAATLLFSLVIRRYVAIRNVVGRLGGQDQSNVLDTFSNSVVSANTKLFDSEVIQLLNQLGWRKARHRMAFFALQIGLPLILALLVLMLQSVGAESSDSDDSMFWLMLLLVLGIGYLIPKRILVKSAKARQQRLAVEVSTMIPLLRMLFEVGMTVEQSLRVLVNSGEKILPELTIELEHILLRVDAGLELGAELRHTAFLMQVDELTDTFTILEQLIHQGGGGMSSLLSLKELIDDRRMTTLQERVSKMSAKMSIVMMVFLFPALLIILAGPGFIAIIQALGDMG